LLQKPPGLALVFDAEEWWNGCDKPRRPSSSGNSGALSESAFWKAVSAGIRRKILGAKLKLKARA